MKFPGKRWLCCLACMTALGADAHAQKSDQWLDRTRKMDLEAGQAWARTVDIARSSQALVNTFDPESWLLSFTLPLSRDDVRRSLLDAKEVEKQPHMVSVTIWISEGSEGVRAYARAVPSMAGFLSHSNGAIESGLLSAIGGAGTWKPGGGGGAETREFSNGRKELWEALLAVVESSERITVNEAREEAGLLSFSLFIHSSKLSSYAPAATKGYYPGSAHFTLWLEESTAGTRVLVRSLLLEAGNLSPVPLRSNGKLEDAVFAAAQRYIRDGSLSLEVGSSYRGEDDLWTTLFHRPPMTGEEIEQGQVEELPVPPDQAWEAALRVLTQSAVILKCDAGSGVLNFVSAHASQGSGKYSVHEGAIRISPSRFGARLSMSARSAGDTPEESEAERQTLFRRISTELFIKDRLKWLLERKGGG